MFISKKRIVASDDVDETIEEPVVDEGAETGLLFEAEDVAQLITEITGEDVDVAPSDDGEYVDFTVGDEVYTVEAEGDEEILESVRRPIAKKRSVAASRQVKNTERKPVKSASTRRRIPSAK